MIFNPDVVGNRECGELFRWDVIPSVTKLHLIVVQVKRPREPWRRRPRRGLGRRPSLLKRRRKTSPLKHRRNNMYDMETDARRCFPKPVPKFHQGFLKRGWPFRFSRAPGDFHSSLLQQLFSNWSAAHSHL